MESHHLVFGLTWFDPASSLTDTFQWKVVFLQIQQLGSDYLVVVAREYKRLCPRTSHFRAQII
jgi:hypothetical protein